MEETLYAGLPLAEKIELLKANCKTTEKQQIKMFFSEDDLSEMKSRLSELSIERNADEEELKELSKGLRDKIKESSGRIKGLLTYLKDKFELQLQDVYEFDDQEEGVMCTYNQDGELINTRKLRPNERQTRIINLDEKKTA